MTRVLVDLLFYTGTKGGMESYVREVYSRFAADDPDLEFVGWASTELAATDSSWFPGRVVDSGISGEDRVAWARGEVGVYEAAQVDRNAQPATRGGGGNLRMKIGVHSDCQELVLVHRRNTVRVLRALNGRSGLRVADPQVAQRPVPAHHAPPPGSRPMASLIVVPISSTRSRNIELCSSSV